MKTVRFTPRNLSVGESYIAELLRGADVQQSVSDLVENEEISFTVTIPGNYTLRVRNVTDDKCLLTLSLQLLFPIVTYLESDVNCTNNTYTFSNVLTNPITAGQDVQYGWSLNNSCSLVNNWSPSVAFILPADDLPRYIFVKNSSQQCCNYVATSSKSPCLVCTLEVVNISFNCNG